jgi:hypothetical protein
MYNSNVIIVDYGCKLTIFIKGEMIHTFQSKCPNAQWPVEEM